MTLKTVRELKRKNVSESKDSLMKCLNNAPILFYNLCGSTNIL